MAYFKFTNRLVKGEKIQLYNYGDMWRDFTYIDDVITGIMKILEGMPKEDGQGVCHKIYNIGNSKPENLLYFVELLEKCLIEEGIIKSPVEKELLSMQKGDVYRTYADIGELVKDYSFRPMISLEEGLGKFARWYKEYYTLL